ncbi:MAG TPA: PhoX family phosphatase [Jiangellaceae bacterium]|nr:PhoX family phosphatase [Jiangellaceae bacterium]
MSETTGPTGIRRLLPVLGAKRHGNRDLMTCQYRCGNQCDHPVPNTSENTTFQEIATTAISRRNVLRGGAAAGLVIGASSSGLAGAAAGATGSSTAATGLAAQPRSAGTPPIDISFPPLTPSTLDTVVVPNGHDWDLVIRWGDPVLPGAPNFDIDRQSERAQERQFGYNCDYIGVLPTGDEGRAWLVVNHEYTNEVLMFRGYTDGASATEEHIRVAMAAHGLSVVEIQADDDTGRWSVVPSARTNRRITASTPMTFSGPAAGSDLLQTAGDPEGMRPLGTLNNCAGGMTPWGTTLHGEENFHQYFVGGDGAPEEDKEALERYTIPTDVRYPEGSRRWDRVDDRFDLAQHPHEANRFGWIVELDPSDPRSTPVKHTALGRFKHEGATIRIADDGRVVAYSGDDQAFDYVYKFVSTDTFDDDDSEEARQHNMTLLSSGSLYVAKLTGNSPESEIDGSGELPSDGEFDGTGKWLPLMENDESSVPGMTVEEVLVRTRIAADQAGATKMDRPEDIEPNPVTGRVYCALTNNSDRDVDTVDEANPLARSTVAGDDPAAVDTPGSVLEWEERGNEAAALLNSNGTGAKPIRTADRVQVPGNRNGYVLEWEEQGNDAAALTFSWRLFLVCGDPEAQETYFGGYPKDQVSPISCPDNVAFDPEGNLWISTDGNALGANDGLFAVPVEGENRGRVSQFMTLPNGAECCGPLLVNEGRSVFAAIQHPGEIDGSSVDTPASTFPDGDVPRPSVVVAWNTGRAGRGLRP